MVTTDISVVKNSPCVITRSSLPYCKQSMMPLVATGMALSTTATSLTKGLIPISASTAPTARGSTIRRNSVME